MPWRFLLKVLDAGGAPVRAAGFQLATWIGAGNVTTQPRQTIGDIVSFVVDDNVINVVIDLTHPRFARTAINLVRTMGETAWRWTDPRQQVATRGEDVTVEATLFRSRSAPTTYLPEEDLTRRATAVKQPLDEKRRALRRPPLETVRIDALPGILRDKSNFYRHSGGPTLSKFHLMSAEALDDAEGDGWKRFKSTVHSNFWPWRTSVVMMIEYGEIGTDGPYGPRFLLGIFLPNELLRVGRRSLDFMVWYTPSTREPNYPKVEYPFRGDYPYVLMALGQQPPYEANQRYATLPFAHLSSGQHFLAHQMIAAQRACAIVIPIAPSSHFALWQSPRTLMRMLKDICRWLPRADDGRQAKIHPAPPSVGRVGVSGFSAAGEHLRMLLNRSQPAIYYKDVVWGTSQDALDFDGAWGELWAIDTNLGANFRPFVNQAASWTRHGDRRFRVYKNDFTGHWDPRAESGNPFARAMAGATVIARNTKKHSAVSMVDPSGRIHAISVTQGYVVSPTETDDPKMPDNAAHTATHENMPRLFFGHAAVTSGYTKLS